MIKDESARPVPQPAPVPQRSRFADGEIRPLVDLGGVALVLLLVGEAIIVHTAPLERLFGTTEWSTMGSIHGMVGATIFISGGIALYLGYRLVTGRLESPHDLQLAALITGAGSLLTVLLGNWVYIGYRQPGMAQDYFLANIAEIHWIFFEFKENIAVFTVPLAFAAAFILYRYGRDLNKLLWVRIVIFLLLSLVFLFFLMAFGLGAAITKVKPI